MENYSPTNPNIACKPSFFPVISIKKYNPLKIKELHYHRLKDENRKNMIDFIEEPFENETVIPKSKPKHKIITQLKAIK